MTGARRILLVFGIFVMTLVALYVFAATVIAATVIDNETEAELIRKASEEAAQRYGGCSENPFPYLEQRHTGDKTNSFVTPTADGTKGLDTALACRLKKLIEFAESKGCRLAITSAMRPVQRCNPGGGACARQGNSCHQYGRAVDLGGSAQCLAWLTSVIGRQSGNSPFKVQVAYVENGNYRHVQCSEHPIANASSAGGCRSACTGGISINPDHLANIPGPGSYSPTSGLTDRFRQSLGMQASPSSQQLCTLPDGKQVPCSAIANSPSQGGTASAAPSGSAPPPIGTQNTTPYATGTCSPQFYCSGKTLFYRTSTCVDQVNEVCTNGCSGTSCVGSRPVSDILGEALASTSASKGSSTTTGQSNAQRSTSSLSAFDQIGLLINTAPVGSAAGPDPLILTLDGEEEARLQASLPPPAFTPPEGSVAYVPSPGAQQTFTSGDLSQNPPQGYSAEQRSALQRTLAVMRDALLYALAYLRPFGRPEAAEEHYHE